MAKTPIEIKSLARVHTEAAVKTLVGIMNQPDSPPAARVSAANILLDRGWGKAEQTQNVNVSRMTAREIPDDELAAIAVGRGEGTDTPQIDPKELN